MVLPPTGGGLSRPRRCRDRRHGARDDGRSGRRPTAGAVLLSLAGGASATFGTAATPQTAAAATTTAAARIGTRLPVGGGETTLANVAGDGGAILVEVALVDSMAVATFSSHKTIRVWSSFTRSMSWA